MKRCFNGFGRSLNAGLYLGYLLNPSQRAHTRVALLRAPLQRRGRGHMTGIRARIKAPNLIQPKTCDLLRKSNNLGSNAADAASLQLFCFHSTFQRSAAKLLPRITSQDLTLAAGRAARPTPLTLASVSCGQSHRSLTCVVIARVFSAAAWSVTTSGIQTCAALLPFQRFPPFYRPCQRTLITSVRLCFSERRTGLEPDSRALLYISGGIFNFLVR